MSNKLADKVSLELIVVTGVIGALMLISFLWKQGMFPHTNSLLVELSSTSEPHVVHANEPTSAS